MGFPALALIAMVGNLPLTEPPPSPTADPSRYYILLFGGQGDRFRPRTAHTWSTYVRATTHEDGTVHLDSFTISWLPATLKVRPSHLRPEPGINLTLHETLDHMTTGRHDISLWGPYETDANHYWEAARYKQVLDSGAIRYRVLDGRESRTDVCHCVHAVVRVSMAWDKATDPIVWYGRLITKRVANAMNKTHIADTGRSHCWLIQALGIDRYTFTRRTLGAPLLGSLR